MKKSFEELLEYIKTNSSPEFNSLFARAKEDNRKRKIIFWILAIVIDLIILCYLFSHTLLGSYFRFFYAIYIIFIILFIVDFVLYVLLFLTKNIKPYIKSFKENVIQKLLCNFYENVNYLPNNQIPKTLYDAGKYNEYYNRYYSDDYMEAQIDNKYPIRMAEVHTVEEETHTDSDGHTTTTETTKFHGLFAQVRMEKSINSELLIRRNNLFATKNKLQMDSEEFEKLFDVSTTNQIIGMQLLTHDIMELLVSFKKSTGINYDISIYNNIMYLRFHTGAMFEFKSFKKGAFDEKMLRRYYNVLDFTCTLSKMLIDLIEKTEI